MTPFVELNYLILLSTACILLAGYIDLHHAKKELAEQKSTQEISWNLKRKNLQNYYRDENNLNKSFAECLSKIQVAESQNQRISQILDNYQSSNKKFKIRLNRNPENRIDQYLED